MFRREDNSAMTLRDMLKILAEEKISNPKRFAKALDKPVYMSSDEEGNSTGKLYGIEIAIKGVVTLWPSDSVVP
jgi:hypothetical protein